jgi:CelD/BcsL family acetyltransferase involved in cellulose biosynthesis
LPFPFQRFNALEDIVLTLPATVDAYVANLGKATRRTIRGYMNRLLRAYPSFRFEVFETVNIREHDVMSIIHMNQARMADKDKVSAYHDAEAQRIFQLARACGLVCILLLDERVCAGAVSFRTGSHYFMTLAAHDPQFDAFRLGTLNGFLNISECIKRGGKECHLLWGRHEYKYRFLGVERALDNVAVYRSRRMMLRHADVALKMLAEGAIRLAYCRLHDQKRKNTLAWRVAARAADGWRSLRRIGKEAPPALLASDKLPEE